MGLNKQYLKVGQSAKNRLFGISPSSAKASAQPQGRDKTPLQMLVSEQGKISHSRLAIICLGLFAIAIGIILSSIPWLDYLILKNLRLFNGTLSYYYWQRPGVLRLTKVFIFNVTNPEGFLAGEKPRLEEIGPFVYRENMEKVNIVFHDNGTVSFQHKKILEFLPELSVDKNLKIVVPNIPLLTLTSALNGLSRFTKLPVEISLRVFYSGMKPFKEVTADELIFGYDDRLTSIAHAVYPRGKRPPQKMGLLLGRNGTLHEVSTIHTGQNSMENFGILDRINGMDHLPYWDSSPCNSINASEGSLFPPRSITHSDVVHVYDKDLCRVWPLRYRHDMTDNGINVGYYTPDDSVLESGDVDDNNKCFCPLEECPLKGLQNIRPCHFNAPVFLSFPHFYKASPELLNSVDGLKPDVEKHGTYFKIQPKLGVTTEAKVRVQLNLQVSHSDIDMVKNFRSINFPIVWLEEGVSELTPGIRRWVYLSTTFADNVVPLLQYGLIVFGAFVLVLIFVQAYKNIVFTKENLELGKAKLRRGSSFIVNGQHRLLIIRDSYSLLHNGREQSDSYSLIDSRSEMAETSFDPDPVS